MQHQARDFEGLFCSITEVERKDIHQALAYLERAFYLLCSLQLWAMHQLFLDRASADISILV